MSRAYIYAKLEDEVLIRGLRDRIFRATNASKYYKKVEPHMTIVPPFEVKESHESAVKEVTCQSELDNSQIKFESLSSYTSPEKPYVVSLDVEWQLAQQREQLLDKLEPYLERSPSKEFEPHVTLLKVLVPDADVPDNIKSKIQHEVAHTPPPQSTEIRSLKCEVTG
jgi:2'-5' RNA ligase